MLRVANQPFRALVWDMKTLLLSLAAGLAFLAAGLPAAAANRPDPPTAHYATSMTELYGSLAPYNGSLELQITPDGIVNGYYFPEDYSSILVPVVGGKSGDTIWFDIGSSQLMHVDGRLKDGIIVGTAFTGANTQFTFVAKPAASTTR